MLQKIADLIVELYTLQEKDKQVFHGIANLVNRLINSYPTNHAGQLFNIIRKIDWKPTLNNPRVGYEFVDPKLPFFQSFGDIIKPSQEEIETAFKKQESAEEQQNVMMHCIPLQHSCNDDQNNKYEKKSVLENIENQDIFSQGYPKFYQNDHPISITDGYSEICEEWINGFGIFSSKRVKLNILETKKLFDYIQNYWNKNKQYLNDTFDKNYFMFGSIADEFKARFDSLLKVILFVIIPNTVEANATETICIKQELDTLLNEMNTTKLNISTVKLASLAVFPDCIEKIKQYIRQTFDSYNKQDVDGVILGIWVLFVMKYKKMPFEINTRQFISYIVEHIKSWLSPSLFSALHYLANIISETPEFFDGEIVNEIRPVLEILINETKLTNSQSRIVESNRLTDRREAMRLASIIFKYFEKQNKEQPAEIIKWKELAQSDDEFWEIKNQWNT
jgi:hypothetical protein